MSEGIDFPELHEALLDHSTAQRLFNDLAAHAQVLDVIVKGAATQRTDARRWEAVGALSALLAGHVRAVQVRYLFDGGEWRDTLLRVPGGLRLVRVRTPSA